MPDKIKKFMQSDFIFFSLIFIILAWIYFILPPLSLYSNDEGVKYIQMKNFYLNKTLEIKYPAQNLGLGTTYSTRDSLIFVERGGKLYSTFPLLFTYISSLFYPLLGDRVTHFLAMLAFFLSLLVLSKTLGLLVKKTRLYYILLFTFLIGSPILMYAFTFWEHLPAVLGVICSLYFLARYFYCQPSKLNIFLSAFILSLACFFRTEIIFLIVAYAIPLGFVLFLRRQIREIFFFIIGIIAPLAVYAVFNLINYQNILGLHILYRLPEYHFFIKKIIISLAAILACAVLALIPQRHKLNLAIQQELYNFIPILCLWFFFTALSGVSFISQFFLEFPAVLLIFWGFAKRMESLKDRNMDFGNIVLAAIILFLWLVLYPLFGNQIRFALPVIPLTIVFIASEHKRIFIAKPAKWLFIGFIIFSSGYSLHHLKDDLWRYKWLNTKRIEFLKQYTQEGDAVIFQDEVLMEHAGPLFFNRIYFVASEPDELLKIFNLLKSKGFSHCYFFGSNCDCQKVQFPQQGNYRIMRNDSWKNYSLTKVQLN